MKKPFVWGTQLELQAAADYYEMCIYLLTKRQQQERYHWHRYTPRNSAVPTDNLPHIELAHPGSVHFDPILDAATLQIPKSVPQPVCYTIFEFGRVFYGNTHISVLLTLTLTPTAHCMIER